MTRLQLSKISVLETEVIVVSTEESRYFSISSITPLFNYSSKRGLSKHIGRTLKRNKNVYFSVPTNGGVQRQRFISESELLSVMQSSQTLSEDAKLAILTDFQSFGFLNFEILPTRDEIDFGNSLEKVLLPIGLSLIKQKRIGKYRADFYIPEVKTIIEYDENKHESYSKKEERERENAINTALDVCRLVRITDDKDHLENIGIVLNSIMQMQPDLFLT